MTNTVTIPWCGECEHVNVHRSKPPCDRCLALETRPGDKLRNLNHFRRRVA